ncbi:hypothetical protein ABPG72_021763 [Tetrahymena utriculariae]
MSQMNQPFQSSEQKRRYDLLVKMSKEENNSQKQIVKQYQDVQNILKKADETQIKQINDENLVKCPHPDCFKSYDTTDKLNRHIIIKHKGLAINMKLLSYVCELCLEYGSNKKSLLQKHLKLCKEKQISLLQAQGLNIPEIPEAQKLNEEEQAMLQKAKKFF